MKRKTILAKCLAAALALSSLQPAPLYAAELSAQETQAQGEAAAPEQTAQPQGEAVTSEQAASPRKEAGELNGKAAGRNGVLYEDVAYLSAKNVMAMKEETREAYYSLCDEIASVKDSGLGIEDAVLAVDQSGNLYASYAIPLRELDAIQNSMVREAVALLTPDAKDGAEGQKAAGESEQDKQSAESQSLTDDSKKEESPAESQVSADESKKDEKPAADQTPADGDKKEQPAEGQAPADGDKKEQPAEGQAPADDSKKEQSAEDQAPADDSKKEQPAEGQAPADGDKKEQPAEGQAPADGDEKEQPAEGQAPMDESKKDEKFVEGDKKEQSAASPYVLAAENMEALARVPEETFAVAEPVRLGNVEDLLSADSAKGRSLEAKQFRVALPTEDHFSAQLSAAQKKYYNAAKAKLTAGSNSFSVQTDSVASITKDAAHAICALFLTYPEKMDWVAKPGMLRGDIKYGSGGYTHTFALDKSPFYTAELDAEANQKAQQVGQAAVEYAKQQYADAPMYGVVKYLDQWVCENGYYENIGTRTPVSASEKEIYYHCHSAYGILLKGYGVCESYAKAMARLLDTVGIPNMYVVGDAGGAHAWNYIQMSDGRWYLHDSTWNDDTDPAQNYSSERYLLVGEDGVHVPTGQGFNDGKKNFSFTTLSSSRYDWTKIPDALTLSDGERSLMVGKTWVLTSSDLGGVWSSSNQRVAKVGKNGKVTAVAVGTAVITYKWGGQSATCTVKVNQVRGLTLTSTGKTAGSLGLSVNGGSRETRELALTVKMGSSPQDAEQLVANGALAAPVATSTKPAVATVDVVALQGNTLTVAVEAQNAGAADVKVKFGGKTVTVKVSVGVQIREDMFDIIWPAGTTTDSDGQNVTPYTGKDVKPKVRKKAGQTVTFKVGYRNNRRVGTAAIVLKGTGRYKGTVEIPFTIASARLSGAVLSGAASKVYTGGPNLPAVTVKYGGKTLSAGKDYEVLYDGKTASEFFGAGERQVFPAGSYTITARGIGNYSGVTDRSLSYVVRPNTIEKVTVVGVANAGYAGGSRELFQVKIGKYALPEEDYEITWYQGQGSSKSAAPMQGAPVRRGRYTAVLEVKGKNLTAAAGKTKIEKKVTIQ